MIQNLRFTNTYIESKLTNISTSKTLSYGNLTSGNSYTEPRIFDSESPTYGVWYNYCAASAGTICDNTTMQDATYSLCPAGWQIPTHSQFSDIIAYASAHPENSKPNFYSLKASQVIFGDF